MFSYLNPLPSLPQYAGPHKVAVTDYEIPVSEISLDDSGPDSQISTIKFRVYYPTGSDQVAKESVYWLPDPQKQWNAAYASFLGASSTWASVVSRLWSVTNYAKLPVIKNAPLLAAGSKTGLHPVCIFSHGLGGNTNIYSSIVGSLASCGVVTIAPEHRDGSSPVSFIKTAKGEVDTTIPYQKLSHSPDAKVLNARNAQLRIRLWELELTYTAIKAMNEGKSFTNYANGKKEPVLDLRSQLNFSPSSVTWAGHSFGAATITQFVKSIFYHQNLPDTDSLHNNSNDVKQEWDWTPLYKTKTGSDLIQQITPESPVALLDIWTMPLRGETTSWLWDLPMPCYARKSTVTSKPNTVAMISGEFYGYKGMQDRTRALLSQKPSQAIEMIESGKESINRPLPPDLSSTFTENPIPELSKNEPMPARIQDLATITSSDSSRTTSPARSNLDTPNVPSPTSSRSSLPLEESDWNSRSTNTTIVPHLYHIPRSAHLSQSDFGLLFPNITKLAMKAIDPEKTIEMNVRAILAVMRNQDLPVESLVERNGKRDANEYILEENMGIETVTKINGGEIEVSRRRKEEERWLRVPLVQV